jgi:hypothetical protein
MEVSKVTPFGSATKIPVIAVSQEGRVLSIEEVSPAIEATVPIWTKFQISIQENSGHVLGWYVDGVRIAALAATQAQTVVVASLLAGSHVIALRLKPTTRFTGPTAATIALGMGTTLVDVFYEGADFSILDAVGNTNILTVTPRTGNITAAAENLTFTVTAGDGETVDDLETGAFDLWVLASVVP